MSKLLKVCVILLILSNVISVILTFDTLKTNPFYMIGLIGQGCILSVLVWFSFFNKEVLEDES